MDVSCFSSWHCLHVFLVGSIVIMLYWLKGTILKNKYGGTLLTACASDGNDQIFPLAFCVDYVNDRLWQWFMYQLKKIIGIGMML